MALSTTQWSHWQPFFLKSHHPFNRGEPLPIVLHRVALFDWYNRYVTSLFLSMKEEYASMGFSIAEA